MPELLIELFSEEIPARMQKRAEEDFARLLGDKLKAAGLSGEGAETFSGPRRLALRIADLPAATPDVSEERKGPRVGAPAAAMQGFLKSAGLARIDDAIVQSDPKGDFYVARIERRGRATEAVVAEALPEIIRAFPWPKSMRTRDADWTWVRPLQNILCVFAGKPVAIAMPGVKSEALAWGHRVHGAGAIPVTGFADYAEGLRKAHVLIDREERKALIVRDARAACAARGLELVEDIGLLDEVTGLVEWPVVLLGDMAPDFLTLPGEVIRLSMRTHQKYFAVRDPQKSTEGAAALAPHFVVVANIAASDGGKAIAQGNGRVLSARLNDARFFWDGDRKTPLYTEARREKLTQIVFHQKLGSVWDKVERVRALAAELCAVTGADAALVDEAARLCKMDLVTDTVGEFPELQGQVGRQLFLLEREGARSPAADAPRSARPPPLTPPHKGEGNSVAQAIEDHYRPLGPNDRVPSDPVAVTLALADKLDTLVGFWAIDEKPTGSSDPYALRRAALGLVSIVLENSIRLNLRSTIWLAAFRTANFLGESLKFKVPSLLSGSQLTELIEKTDKGTVQGAGAVRVLQAVFSVSLGSAPLLAFLADRLKVQLREQGKRHDLVDAVFSLGDDDLVRIVARVEALDAFLKTDDGKNLLAGYRRAANILRAEEKKNATLSDALQRREYNPERLVEPAENSLHAALERAAPEAERAMQREDFAGAMAALAQLRAPVDAFFENVLVNAEDANLRLNRLRLLFRVRAAIDAVADFSKVEGA